MGREVKPRPNEMMREGAWWRAEGDAGRNAAALPERYHGLRNSEWKTKKKEYYDWGLTCA